MMALLNVKLKLTICQFTENNNIVEKRGFCYQFSFKNEFESDCCVVWTESFRVYSFDELTLHYVVNCRRFFPLEENIFCLFFKNGAILEIT